MVWVAAERLPQFQSLWPDARLVPEIAAPASYAERDWSADLALVEILRGRLEGLGPVSAEALAAPLGVAVDDLAAALAALETEWFCVARPGHAGRRKRRMVRTPAVGTR